MSSSSTTKSSKLVLVDGNAIMHRAYHAMPKLTNRRGEAIGAVYGFTSMLLKIIEDLKPTHISVCFDRKEPTFRKKEYKEYQAQRPETEEDLISQFGKAKQVAGAMNIPSYDKKGFEADDLIGTISKSSKGKIDEVIIVTGDKDIMQLIDDRIFVYLPVRGLSQAKMMKRRDVYGKLGVYPEQIIDYKALMGDPSDNYPGVFGIGPKTAEQLLSKYKTYKSVYKHLDDIPENTAKKLREGKEGGDISYKLAQIVTDVNFDYDLTNMDNWDVSSGDTLELFDEIGFRSLKKRVEKMGVEKEEEKQGNLF